MITGCHGSCIPDSAESIDLLVTVLAILAGPPATCDGAAILNAAAGLRDRPKPLRDTGWPMMLAFDPL